MSEKKLLKAKIKLLKDELSFLKNENYRILRSLTEEQSELRWAKEDITEITNGIARIAAELAELGSIYPNNDPEDVGAIFTHKAEQLCDIIEGYAPDDLFQEIWSRVYGDEEYEEDEEGS